MNLRTQLDLDWGIYANRGYRKDIQGVRAIGAILIMVYHIWFSKVSGGVDVFFVVSGYFMTGMLIRSYLKTGKLNPIEFWGRIAKRIAPLTYVVILTTVVAGYFFMPPHFWRGEINEALTSALHFQNWQLIRVSTNYLSGGESPSPLQQFWALSIQVQFYLFLPIVLYLSFIFSQLYRSQRALPVFVVFLIAVSFAFSIYYTELNPSASYFHTGTRAWEFLVGVLAFLLSPYFHVSPNFSRSLALLGVFVILSTGFIVPEQINYPGYVAIIPVAAAAMVILAAPPRNSYVHEILSSKVLVYIGGISFSLYLWHWPILVYYRYHTGTNPGEMPVAEGLIVIAIAFGISVASKAIIENPISNLRSRREFLPYLIWVIFLVPTFVFTYYVRSEIVRIYDEARSTDYVKGEYYQEGGVHIQSGPANMDLNRMIGINYDLTAASLHGCSRGVEDGEVNLCEFGDITKKESILMVGGSRIAHWEPFFSYLGKKHGFKVITATINACSFGNRKSIEGSPACQEWNRQILDRISTLEPKPKFVIANTSRQGEQGEYTPNGYVKNIAEVIGFGIPVIGIRINPRYINPRYPDPNSCLWREDDVSLCSMVRSQSLNDENPVLKVANDLPGFYPVDFTQVLCKDDRCPTYFDGYPVMRDGGHFTRSYVTYLSKSFETSLDFQVGGFARLLDRYSIDPSD